MESLDPLVPLDTSKQLTIESLQEFKPGSFVKSSNLKDFIVGNYNLDYTKYDNGKESTGQIGYTFDGKELEMIKLINGWTPETAVKLIKDSWHTYTNKTIKRSYDNCMINSDYDTCRRHESKEQKSEYKSLFKTTISEGAKRIKKHIKVFDEFVDFLKENKYFPVSLDGPTYTYTYKVISSPDELLKLTGSGTLHVTSLVHTGKLFIIFDKDNKVKTAFVIYEDKDGEETKKRRVFIEVDNKNFIWNQINVALNPPMNGGRRFSRKYKKLNKRIKSSKRSYRKPKSRRTRRQRK